jgi:acetolactate synthase-1/2/3 large subunit
MTGSVFLAETLQANGVDHVFFMPVIVPRALVEMERFGIRRIVTHSEKAAAYMADAYARVRRKPGVCMSQSVGAVNLAAGLQDAFLGCSPVLAITGRQTAENQGRHAYQEVDHSAPFGAVTKFSAHVSDVAELPHLLQRALQETVTGTPGPAHLDFEGFVGHAATAGETQVDLPVEGAGNCVPPARPVADQMAIDRAVALLASAERPIIIAGGGVTLSGAGEELVALAEKMQIPVATSLNAKTMMPANHPLAVGVCGMYSRECANRAVSEADLVFFVGSHTGGQVTNDWTVPAANAKVMQLDIEEGEIGRNYALVQGIHADAKVCLQAMTDVADNVVRETWVRRIQELVQTWRESVAELLTSDEVPIRPERLCQELTNHLPEDAILVSDTGHAGIWTGTMIDLPHPEQSYVRCAGSLGWAIPGAIGAKCAAPDRPVVCFTGDGGAWYHLTELDTAARYDIPAVFVVNNNASLNQEKQVNEKANGGQTNSSDSLWHLADRDFAALGEAMGCLGLTVRQPGEMKGALDRAFTSGRPTIIDVKSHIDGIAPAAWVPQ